MTAKRERVGVLMGGLSAEREVSLRTGAAVAAALRRRGYRVSEIDAGRSVAADLRRRRITVAFIALHGRGGEDGSMQGLLECLGIPYTGSGVLASALAMDKAQAKWAFRRDRLPTPPFAVVPASAAPPRRGARWPWPALRPPVVVKPCREGSTIGLSVVRRVSGLGAALKKARRPGDAALVEAFVPGRELTVGVFRDDALPVLEVVAPGGLYDYRAKYVSGRTAYLVPAPLPAALARRVQRLAVRANRSLGCRGATRVDFRLTPAGKPFLLEVNTIPGMTETSLLPKAAREAGVTFDELVEMILREALDSRSPGGRGR